MGLWEEHVLSSSFHAVLLFFLPVHTSSVGPLDGAAVRCLVHRSSGLLLAHGSNFVPLPQIYFFLRVTTSIPTTQCEIPTNAFFFFFLGCLFQFVIVAMARLTELRRRAKAC